MITLWRTDAQNILKTYNELTDMNDHDGALVILARAYGTGEELDACLKNREYHYKEFNKPYGESKALKTGAYDAANRYYYKLVADAKPSITKEDESNLWKILNPS
jgi:hypothetical protein